MTTTDSLTVVTPELVTWMRGYLRDHKRGIEGTSKARAVRAWLDAHDYDSMSQSPYHLTEFVAAYDEARRNPIVTVADIPAGDTPASLYIAPDAMGTPALWHRTGWVQGDLHVLYLAATDPALRALIEAHVPTVTKESQP